MRPGPVLRRRNFMDRLNRDRSNTAISELGQRRGREEDTDHVGVPWASPFPIARQLLQFWRRIATKTRIGRHKAELHD